MPHGALYISALYLLTYFLEAVKTAGKKRPSRRGRCRRSSLQSVG